LQFPNALQAPVNKVFVNSENTNLMFCSPPKCSLRRRFDIHISYNNLYVVNYVHKMSELNVGWSI